MRVTRSPGDASEECPKPVERSQGQAGVEDGSPRQSSHKVSEQTPTPPATTACDPPLRHLKPQILNSKHRGAREQERDIWGQTGGSFHSGTSLGSPSMMEA